MPTLETARLSIAPLTERDAVFVYALVNDAAWLRFIGDKHVRSIADAQRYLRDGPLAMYTRHGHGLYRVTLRAAGAAARPLGMCGLLRREALPDPDLGFAFLPDARGQGYAREAAAAVLADGFGRLQLQRVLAIVDPDNLASVRVLEAIGMSFDRDVALSGEAKSLRLFTLSAPAP